MNTREVGVHTNRDTHTHTHTWNYQFGLIRILHVLITCTDIFPAYYYFTERVTLDIGCPVRVCVRIPSKMIYFGFLRHLWRVSWNIPSSFTKITLGTCLPNLTNRSQYYCKPLVILPTETNSLIILVRTDCNHSVISISPSSSWENLSENEIK